VFRYGLVLLALTRGWAQEPPVYYISPSGDDQQSGLSPVDPWRTLARAQRALADGVELRLERGGTFAGGLTLNNARSITISAYGAGSSPVITGLARLTDWQSLGGHRWRANCSACTAMPSVFTRDGVAMPLARWPNPDEADGGYRYFQSASGKTGITDSTLSNEIDWTGGEAVVRSASWILDRLPIKSHTGHSLVFSTSATYDLPTGSGYFIQNHAAALDRDGEWAFDGASRTLTMYLADDVPASHTFAVSVTNILVSIAKSQNIEIRDVLLEGARSSNLEISGSGPITILRVASVQSGDTGMRCIDCRNLLIEDSRIDAAANHGLDVYNCTDCVVQRNRITNTATVPGMGRSGNGQYNGVRFGGTNARFARNEITRTGYLGIDVRGAAAIVQNVISQWNMVKTDGGGIYTWGNANVDIIGNLVHDAAGTIAGKRYKSPETQGIYIDDQCENVRVQDNTVSSVPSYGIFLHNTRNVSVERNTVVGAGESQIAYIDDDLGSYRVTETTVRDNFFVATKPDALLARASTTGAPDFFRNIGTISGNRYCAPFSDGIFATSVASQPRMFLGQWQQLLGSDADAQLCPQHYSTYQVTRSIGANRVDNGTFDKDLHSWFGWPAESLSATWDRGAMQLRHTSNAPIIHYDAPVGLIETGKYYRARFTAYSSAPDRLMRVYLRKWDPDYRNLSMSIDVPLSDKPREYDLILPSTQNEPRSLLIFELPSASQVVWLDNVVLEPVEASTIDPGDMISVTLNPTPEPQWTEFDGSRVPVQPYSSAVLFRRR
jgi:parallel beta-helix repeat protein